MNDDAARYEHLRGVSVVPSPFGDWHWHVDYRDRSFHGNLPTPVAAIMRIVEILMGTKE